MRKLYLLLPVILFIGLSCEAILESLSEEEDTTPPTVSISSHISGQTVNEIVTITVITEDNEGISKVEFYINDSLVLTDSVPPYEYEWDTEQYEHNSEHTVKVISYDESDNSTESETITLIVYRENFNFVELWGELYSIEDTDTLALGDSGLSGSIPPEIGNLTNLIYLDLFDNVLTGSIPPEIGNLTNLTELNLGRNQLTGEIPPEIGNLTNLGYLGLMDNQLTGIIPDEICNQGASSIFLGNNHLCPPYPSCIEDDVGEQDISNCEIDSVELWGELYSIEDTDTLALGDSGLSGSIPPEIGNLTNLVYLDLGRNDLTGIIPSEIWNLTKLTYLDLYKFNEFDSGGTIPPEIGDLIDLRYLKLRGCGLSGSIPPEIGNLTSLELLWLAHNQLTGSIPPEIGNLTNLTDFQLYGNQLSGIVPDEICNMDISVLTDSYVFDNNQLCPPYPSCIEDGVGDQDTSNCN